jgi:oligoribonuclease NrnB/cAMP/cGMP phosphodiesterase (DHH superfamily)
MAQSVNQLEREGTAILRKMDKDIAEFLPLVTRTIDIQGYRVPCANVPYFWCSEVGGILAKGAPFSATYYDAADRRVFSLRSDKDDPKAVDVSEIAAQFGGGGHKNASGFSFKLPLLGDEVYTEKYLQEHDVYA